MEMENIVVVGAGQLGGGIAQVAIQSGFRVVLADVDDSITKKALEGITGSLQRQVEKGSLDEATKANMLKRLTITTDLSQAKDADVVIEAVLERVDLKQRVLAQLDSICPPKTIFASNTTSIPITKLASATKRPDRVIGMHFVHPVAIIRSLEIVRGYLTSDETDASIEKLSRDLGREPINRAKDYAGFGSIYPTVNNSASKGYAENMNRYVYSLYYGLATVQEVEGAQVGGGMNPLAWIDLVGLDTILGVLHVLYEEYGLTKFFPCPLLKRLVEAGHLGQKTGIGFYDYSKSGRKAETLSPWFLRLVAREP